MTNQVSDQKLLIEAGAKAVVCVLFVVMIGYSVFAEVEVPAPVFSLALTLLAAYFGLSARSTLRSRTKG